MNPLSPPSFQGLFWLPESPQFEVPGRFSCTEEGLLQLDLLGTFSEDPFGSNRGPLPRVLGVSERGKLVTLENCFYLKTQVHLPGLAVSTIRVNQALMGCHFERDQPIRFHKVSFFSDAINEWLEFAPIETHLASEPSMSATIFFVPPQPVEWVLSNGAKHRIESSWTASPGTGYREAKLNQKSWISLDFNEETPVESLLTGATRFLRFVSFVVDQMLPFNEINAYSAALVEDSGAGQMREMPIGIFFSPDVRHTPDLVRVRSPYPLFSFSEVKDRFGDLVSAWLGNYEKFDASFNLYFGTKTGRDLYLDNRFLMLAQALESLHRHSSTETTFSPDDYAQLCTLLEQATPERFREWLDQRLRYANELSLRKRLKLLFESFQVVYGDTNKIAGLIARVVDTRNYLTHFDASLRQRAARGVELWRLCLSLETLFQLHMATMAGLSEDQAIDLSGRSQSFRRKLGEASPSESTTHPG